MNKRPLRLLHVIGAMCVGGIENWLVQVLRRLDRDRFRLDILTHTEEECFYDKEVKALGSRLLPCLHPSRPWAYAHNFFRILKENGPYDVVHSHLFRYTGFIMRLAAAAGVTLRFAQSHTTAENRRLTIWRHFYNKLMTLWINQHSTHLLAVSQDAAMALFGPKSLADPRLHIIPPGIDLIPFKANFFPEEVKVCLGFPKDGKIVGHVGRFEKAKNHIFFLQIAQILTHKDPNIRFLLVGDGPLKAKVEETAKDQGLIDRMVFGGFRSDVPRILKGSVNLLLFPSKWEGFGRVIVEAQAAGVPCLISDVIPTDVDLVKPLVKRLSLSEPPEIWAEAAYEILHSPKPISQEEAFRLVAESPFNIENNVRDLERLYLTAWESLSK